MKQKLRQFFLPLVIIGTIISIPLTVYVAQQNQEVRSRASAPTTTPPYLAITPATATIRTNEEFSADIYMYPGGNNITGIEMKILFDPDKLELTHSFTATNSMNAVINEPQTPNVASNQITFSATAPSLNPLSTNAKIGTITFKAKTTGPTTVSFSNVHMIAAGQSNYIILGENIPATYAIIRGNGSSNSSPLPISGGGTPLPSSASGNTQLKFTLSLVGISGENGNSAPKTTQKPIEVVLLDNTNKKIAKQTGTLAFDTTTKKFTGSITISQSIVSSNYFVKVKVGRYLQKLIGRDTNQITIPIIAGSTVTLPETTLIVGDANSDNSINVLDYNILRDCGAISPERSAISSSADCVAKADFNDNGTVDAPDYNWFIRGLSTVPGD